MIKDLLDKFRIEERPIVYLNDQTEAARLCPRISIEHLPPLKWQRPCRKQSVLDEKIKRHKAKKMDTQKFIDLTRFFRFLKI